MSMGLNNGKKVQLWGCDDLHTADGEFVLKRTAIGVSLNWSHYMKLNSNPPFFLCLNTSFVFTNYQPIKRKASYNRTVRIMLIYCIMQHGFYVSNTIYLNFSCLEFKWYNDLETRHPWIWIASACGLVDSDFTNDEFLGHYPIRKSTHFEARFYSNYEYYKGT